MWALDRNIIEGHQQKQSQRPDWEAANARPVEKAQKNKKRQEKRKSRIGQGMEMMIGREGGVMVVGRKKVVKGDCET
ncbi:hypothetical protein ACNIU2_26630, partial [Escherichia coli]